jgi:hypothetical protein
LFYSISIDPIYNQGSVVRGIKTLLDSKKHTTLAVQLSNRNVMLINLESQVFSQKKTGRLAGKDRRVQNCNENKARP